MKLEINKNFVINTRYLNKKINNMLLYSENNEVIESKISRERFSDNNIYKIFEFQENSLSMKKVSEIFITSEQGTFSSSREEIENNWFKAADSIIVEDTVEFLQESNLEVFFKQTLDNYIDAELLGEHLIEKYYKRNANIERKVIAILHALSHIDYDKIETIGPSIAGRCLSNKNIEIVEFALKAFENWASKEDLPFLESLNLKEMWLNNYVDEIINYIRGIENDSCKENCNIKMEQS